MSIVDSLITDRTSSDVSRLAALTKRGFFNLSEREKREWFFGRAVPLAWADGEAISCTNGVLSAYDETKSNKGAYNALDLNRVTEALEYVSERLAGYGYQSGYEPLVIDHGDTSDTVWRVSDIPTASQMEHYLSNVRKLRAVLQMLQTTPQVPDSMSRLTYQEANDIEKILVDVDRMIDTTVKEFRRSGQFMFYSGYRPIATAVSDLGRTWEELDAMETTWENWQAASWYLLLYGNLKGKGEVM